MKKESARLIFSIVFLFIFFVKMGISVAPLLADHLDSKIMNAVIMQLEIETNSSKGADQVKDSLTKAEWLSGFYKFNFEQAPKLLANKEYIDLQDYHIEAFYPTIPSPPPNC